MRCLIRLLLWLYVPIAATTSVWPQGLPFGLRVDEFKIGMTEPQVEQRFGPDYKKIIVPVGGMTGFAEQKIANPQDVFFFTFFSGKLICANHHQPKELRETDERQLVYAANRIFGDLYSEGYGPLNLEWRYEQGRPVPRSHDLLNVQVYGFNFEVPEFEEFHALSFDSRGLIGFPDLMFEAYLKYSKHKSIEVVQIKGESIDPHYIVESRMNFGIIFSDLKKSADMEETVPK
jgi:hypothetical protein